MRFSLKHQVHRKSHLRPTIQVDSSRTEKKRGSLITYIEEDAREVLLFSTSLIFLLFNLLGEHREKS
jgi:hypothetical protein